MTVWARKDQAHATCEHFEGTGVRLTEHRGR